MNRETIRVLWPETTSTEGRGASVWLRQGDEWHRLADWAGLAQAERRLTASILETGHSRYIGYAEFAVGDYDVSAMVVPKTLYALMPSKAMSCQPSFGPLDKAFVAYLSRYFELLATCPKEDLHRKRIGACHLQLAKELGGAANVGHPSELLAWQVTVALSNVARFFKQHPPHVAVSARFVSDALDGALDIAACVVELDKSRLHQSKPAEAIDAALAAVATGVLGEFLKRLVSQGTTSLGVIAKKARELQYRLTTTYRVKSSKFDATVLNGAKAAAVFNSSPKRALLGWLRILAGSHSMPEGETQTRGRQPVKGLDAIFCSGQALFELAARDVLRNLAPAGCSVGGNSKNTFGDALATDAKTYQVARGDMLSGELRAFWREAKPDNVIATANAERLLVLDAKWKRFQPMADDSQHDESIKFEDVAKLWRDATVYSETPPTEAVLLFPLCVSGLGATDYFHKQYQFPRLWPGFKVHAIGIDMLNVANNKALAGWLTEALTINLNSEPTVCADQLELWPSLP